MVQYDKYFTEASKKYGVDKNLLIAVAKTESGINANAVSSAGAVGVMQLMPATARGLGVTDSFNPEQNINGGAKYLSQLLDTFDGNTELALSAYNAGASRVKSSGGVVLPYTEQYVDKVMSEYNGRGGGSISGAELAERKEQTELVWWADVVRFILLVLLIGGVVLFLVLGLKNTGVTVNPKETVKKAVKEVASSGEKS